MVQYLSNREISLSNILKESNSFVPQKRQNDFIQQESFKDILSQTVNYFKQTNISSPNQLEQHKEIKTYKETNLEKKIKLQQQTKSNSNIIKNINQNKHKSTSHRANENKENIEKNKTNSVKNTNQEPEKKTIKQKTEEKKISNKKENEEKQILNTLFENLIHEKQSNHLETKEKSTNNKKTLKKLFFNQKTSLKEILSKKSPKEIAKLLKKILLEKKGLNLKELNLKEISQEEFKQFTGIHDSKLIEKLKQSLELLQNNKAFTQLLNNEKIIENKSDLLNILSNNKNVSRETKSNKHNKLNKTQKNLSNITSNENTNKETNIKNNILEFNLKQENIKNLQKEQNGYLSDKIDKYLDKKDNEINSTFQQLTNSGKSIKDLIKQESIKQEVYKKFDNLLNRSKVFIKNKKNATLFTKLFPEKLGKINLKLVMTNGQIHGKFLVESEEVQKLLQDRLMKLAENMNAEGFQNTSFDVNVFSQEGKFNEFTNGQQQEKNQIQYNINNRDYINNETMNNNNSIHEGVFYA